jgi:hypothetical protein
MVVLVVLLASMRTAHTQSPTYGAIRGRVVDGRAHAGLLGMTVTVRAARDTRVAQTAEDGTFRIRDLPPGEYTVSIVDSDGRAVVVSRAHVAAMRDTTLTELVVDSASRGNVPVAWSQLDPASAATGFIADREYLVNVPLPGRLSDSVLGATPGARGDDYGIAFFDASSADNRFLLDSVDTTELRYGVGGASVPIEFLQEAGVTTSGLPPDLGANIGGLVSLVTRSGTNEFHGSVFGVIAPGLLQSAVRTDPSSPRAIETIKVAANRLYDTGFGFEVGGPIVRDHAWFYVGFAPQLASTDDTRTIQSQTDCRKVQADGSLSVCDSKYQDGKPDVDPKTGAYILERVDSEVRTATSSSYPFIAKVDVAPSPAHQGAVTAFVVPSATETPGLYGTASTGSRVSTLTTDVGAHWTSRLLDESLRLDAQVGWHRSKTTSGSVDSAFDTQPQTLYLGGDLGQLAAAGGESAATAALCADQGPQDRYPLLKGKCPLGSYAVGGPGALADDLQDRKQGLLALGHRFVASGTHDVKVGVSATDDYIEVARVFSGGKFIQSSEALPGQTATLFVQQYVNVAAPADPDPRFNVPCSLGAREERCQIVGGTPGAPGTINDGEAFTWTGFAQDTWRPRSDLTIDIGLRYDKERLLYPHDLRGGIDPFTDARLGDTAVSLRGAAAPRAAVSYDPSEDGRTKVFASWGRYLEPLTPDIIVGGFTRSAVLSSTFVSMRPYSYVLAATGNTGVASDLSLGYVDQVTLGGEYSPDPATVIAATAVHRTLDREVEDVSFDGASSFVLANPGEGIAARFDKPSRNYNALILSATRRLSARLGVQASYTYSRTAGNYPGTIYYDGGSLEPHRSPQFDLIELLGNRIGPLPQDRPHYFKLDAFYAYPIDASSTVVLGGRYRALSGTPVDALGSHYLYGPNESFLLPRGALGRTPFTNSLDVHAAYRRRLPRGTSGEVFVDVINALDTQDVYTIDQAYTGGLGNANPIAGGSYRDLVWLKSIDAFGLESSKPTERNPHFMQPSARYGPRYAMVGGRLVF